jgi:glycosyltransferase involved in cell wall biosynthesis
MLEGFDIVCLGTVAWLVVRSVAEHSMLRLARRNRVLFVEPFNSFPAVIREARWQRRRMQRRWGLRRADEGVWVYTPPPLGLPGAARRQRPSLLNGRLLAGLLRRQLRSLGIRRPIVWTFLWNSVGVIRALDARLTIYDCIDQDEELAASERRRRLVRTLEQALCQEVDIVFGVTERLVTARRRFNPNTFEVNTAADTEHFGRARLAVTEIPADLAKLPRPVIGYMGGLDPWKIDTELLCAVARARPRWTFALVGYSWFGFDTEPLRQLPNVHLLGPKRYEDFPGYLKGMDVCLMPFRLNEVTRNGDSLKGYEYLAAGKPVVSTPVPVALRFGDIVRTATTVDEFVAAVEMSLHDDGHARDRRVEAVKPHSWEARVRQKSMIIADCLAAKGTGRP